MSTELDTRRKEMNSLSQDIYMLLSTANLDLSASDCYAILEAVKFSIFAEIIERKVRGVKKDG